MIPTVTGWSKGFPDKPSTNLVRPIVGKPASLNSLITSSSEAPSKIGVAYFLPNFLPARPNNVS